MSKDDDDEVVASYWRHYELAHRGERAERLEADAYFWAWESVDQRMDSDAPEAAVATLCALAASAPDDQALGYLGAGPIEDLLCRRAEDVVGFVDDAARRDERFRAALRCAWYDEHVPDAIARQLRRFGDPT